MTSKQIMRTLSPVVLAAGALLSVAGCQQAERVEHTVAPYETRQVFAVAPFRNESGSVHADGARLADKLTQRLSLARGLDALPVNRVLAAMQALGMQRIANKGDAIRLRQTLGVDGLVVATVTAYEPYSPPKLGVNLELYLDDRLVWSGGGLDTRELSAAATDHHARLPGGPSAASQPVVALGAFYDAADPEVLDLLGAYVVDRGPAGDSHQLAVRRHLISIDLYTEFVSHQLTSRLLDAERVRLRRPTPGNTVLPPPAAQPASPQAFAHPAQAATR